MSDRNEYARTLIRELGARFSSDSIEAGKLAAKTGGHEDVARQRVLESIHRSLVDAEHQLDKLIEMDKEANNASR